MRLLLNCARLCVGTSMRTISTSNQSLLKITPILCAEPLKKKKKLDPAIIKQREERKRKKLEKQIRRLEKNARQLKPIDELEIPLTLLDEKEKRTRPNAKITQSITEQRIMLEKNWARNKMQERLKQLQKIDQILLAQMKALSELKFESEDLYEAAIQTDPFLVPFTAYGPVRIPPVDNCDSPDGDYIDTSKKWE